MPSRPDHKMISTPEKPQAEPCNFFLLPHGTNTEFRHLDDVVDKIQTMQQDAYTLNNIIQRHDLDRTLDKNSVINDTSLSNMADLAASINQALNRILRLEFLNGTSIPEIQVVASSRSRPRRRAKKHPDTVKRCYLCGVTKTPRWRGDPSDPYPVCNFCDLLETKKNARMSTRLYSRSSFKSI